ncbi:MAG: hypothetical protein ACREAK_07560 [Nitrosarchaeum sp.]
MSVEWIVTGIILLGGMTAAGISLWIKRRREAQDVPDLSLTDTETKTDLAEFNEDEK